MVHQLLWHWRTACSDDRLPSLADVYAQDLGYIRDHVVELAVPNGPSVPVVRSVGARIRAYGPVACGEPVTAIPPATLQERAVAHFGEALARRAPIIRGGCFVDAASRTVLYRSVILPISEDGERISHLLCAANYDTDPVTGPAAPVGADVMEP